MKREEIQFSEFAKKRYPEMVARFAKGLSLVDRDKRASIEWRPDAAALRVAGWPLALLYNSEAPKYESAGLKLRSVEKILALHAVCVACPLKEFNGRICKRCPGGCAGKERAYLKAIATEGGKCLAKEPLWPMQASGADHRDA